MVHEGARDAHCVDTLLVMGNPSDQLGVVGQGHPGPAHPDSAQLARAYPLPPQRRVPVPKHGLHHRLKRLWRFLDNPRVAPLAVQAARLTPLIRTC